MRKKAFKRAPCAERVSQCFSQAGLSESPLGTEGVSCPNGARVRPPKAIRHLPAKPIFEIVECPDEFAPQAKALQLYDLILSIDTEYVQDRTAKNKFCVEVPANSILSYQYAAVFREPTGALRYAEGIYYPAKGDRLEYRKLVGLICSRFGIGYRRAGQLQVLSLAHFGVAEWAAYADRMDYLDHLTPVRKVPITLRPMTVNVPFGCGHVAKVKITWRDTCLLTPGGGSLASASETTIYKKLELPDGWISKMAWVLANHKDEFEAYAIGDVRVVLEYYVKTILEFEKLTGIESEPLTLGDAAVKSFISWLDKEDGVSHDSIFGFQEGTIVDEFGKIRRVRERAPARLFSEVIAAQAFMGGLNIAFETGRNKEPGHIYLDIDFSGAYPASLAVIPAIDWSSHGRPVTLEEIAHCYGLGGRNE